MDTHPHRVNYLRLSITDRCNLRCRYCMPVTGIPPCGHEEILRYEDLLRIARLATTLGIEKVRVTGGEPLVRKGVVGFLERLCALPGVAEVALTTNGMLLGNLAGELRDAGIQRVNVSLDSLRADTYAWITRGGELSDVLSGLDVAERAGLRLKLNMVVMRGINDAEIEDFAALTLTRPWSVRFIEYMPTIREAGWRNRVLSGREVLERLQRTYVLRPLPTSRLCGPAKPFQIDGAIGSIGIITPVSEHFCTNCNRIRVTSRGLAKSCLFDNRTIDLRPALAQDDDVLRSQLFGVIDNKEYRSMMPESSGFCMASVGG
jgi:cyclic pyranopterin phosphate synthase